ncbi:collagenase-like [Babylonia areolata]|uniref:collagenase-like n=1 Tax=Babylonia areolata TaxID=304850 RepID=UPI003FD49022
MRSLWFSAAVLLSVWVCDVSTAPASVQKEEDRLLGGTPITDFLDYSFFVHVVDGSFSSMCPGVLYDDTTVITVAHCYRWIVSTTFYAICSGPQFSEVESIHLHPDFGVVNFMAFNDVAVLKLAEPFNISNPYCQPAILPDDDDDVDDLVGADVTVAGFGTDGTGVEVTLEIMDDGFCSSYNPAYNADQQMCLSSSNDQAACYGDAGSPAMLADKTVVGLGSSVLFGCWFDRSLPSYFTRLSSYMDWIEEVAEGED